MRQDKSNKREAWKDEYVCICLRLFFLTIPSKCLLRFTYWDQVTKDAKKEAARYILYVYDWINSLLNGSHCLTQRKIYIHSHCSIFHLLYYLSGSLCISQAVMSPPDFLWGGHFLSWICSMWPACPVVHTDTPVQPVWQPVYCWSYGVAAVQHLNLCLNLIQCCSELGLSSLLLVILIIQYVDASVILCSLNGRHVALQNPHI